jgi:hypothetical protein
MRPLSWAAAAALAAGASCARTEPPPPRPVAWRLGEVAGPSGRELVLEAYDPERLLRIEVRFECGEASIGEEVAAVIRLPGAEGIHEIEAVPDGPWVRLLDPPVLRLRGGETGRVRFTRAVPGRGGVSVRIRGADGAPRGSRPRRPGGREGPKA